MTGIVALILASMALLVACVAVYLAYDNRVWLDQIDERFQVEDALREAAQESEQPAPSPVRDYSILEEAGRVMEARKRKS